MKKFFVIGNPLSHSLSPKLHNYWFKKNNIEATYEKKELKENDLSKVIDEVRGDKISGLNVTVPFKSSVVPFLDELSEESKITKSVNTIFKKQGKIFGHNTDIAGFELSIRKIMFNVQNKKALILGAGGVSPSIIFALKKMKCEEIFLMNRTFEKAQKLKETFQEIEVLKWGNLPEFDLIINATSVGLKEGEKHDLKIDYEKKGKLFYDVIYNPKETFFLKQAKINDNMVENGKMMFIYQAHQSFVIWNSVMPKIDDEVINLIS